MTYRRCLKIRAQHVLVTILLMALLIGLLPISVPWLATMARANTGGASVAGSFNASAAQGCSTLCFRGPEYYLNRLGNLPRGAVLIPGVNFNVPVSTKNSDALQLALRGGSSAQQNFNRHYVAAQLSLLGAGRAHLSALQAPLSCYGLRFDSVRLSNGEFLRTSTTLGQLLELARSAASAGRQADYGDLGDFLDLLNSEDALGGCGTDVGELRVVDLSPNPTPEQRRSALRAYRRGHIVRLIGGTSAHLLELLGVRAAQASARGRESATAPTKPAQLEVVAVRATDGGALHEFHAATGGANAGAANQWQPSFTAWHERARNLAQVSASSSGQSPNSQAWTELQESTHIFGVVANQQARVTVYRLNDINKTKDWYMVTHTFTSSPAIDENGCAALYYCKWPTNERRVVIRTPFPLYDHGPKTKVTETEASFDIGGGLGAEGPTAEVGFGFSWKQESVETTDNTGGPGTLFAFWTEEFQLRRAFTPIPASSSKTFTSYQGAIFEVPEGTKSFPLTINAHVEEAEQGGLNDITDTREMELYVEIPVYAPVLAVPATTLIIAPGEKGNIPVRALIPHSDQGFPWKAFTNQSWLSVASPNSDFSGTDELEIIVAPGTALGTPGGVVSINSDPPFAAPSVVSGPLLVNIMVGQPEPAALPANGVLLAGGLDLLGRPTHVAEVFDPASGQVTPVGSLRTARINHTATTLANGQVLIIGGTSDAQSDAVLATAEIYNPRTGTFTYVNGAAACPPGGGTPGCLVTGRARHTATLLANGKVLIAGGYGADGSVLTTAELYDPATQTFTATGNLKSARYNHAAIRYNDDFVLLVGGVSGFSSFSGPQLATTSEFYYVPNAAFGDYGINNNLEFTQVGAKLFSIGNGPPVGSVGGSPNRKGNQVLLGTGRWHTAPDLKMDREGHDLAAVSLDPGDPRALVTGGGSYGGDNPSELTDTAELVSPFNGVDTKLLTSKMSSPRGYHTATRLPDGRVFIAGGHDQDGVSLGTTDLYQHSSETFSPGPAIFPRARHTASLFNVPQQAATTTTLTSSANPSTLNQPVTFTATVSSSGGTPTGMVTFKDGDTTIGGASLSGGSATFTTSSLAIGAHTITAVFEGSQGFTTSTSAALTQTVNRLATTTTVTASPNPSTPNQAVTFTATVSSANGTPTGTVSFLDGGISFGQGTLSNGVATITFSSRLNPGPHTITAIYAGDANFAGSTSQALTQTVNQAVTTTALTSSVNPSTLNQAVTFTATVTVSAGSAPVGTVTFRDGTTVIGTATLSNGAATLTKSDLTAGAHTITASYDGNTDFAASTSPALTQTVNQPAPAATTTALSSSANPSALNQPVTFIATVNAANGTPSGTVTFRDGGTTLGTATLSNGSASFVTSALTVGAHSITAVYEGNASFATSTSPVLTQTVTQPATVTTLTTDLNPSSFGYVLRYTATVTGNGGTPTGTVTFFAGTTALGAATLSGGTASILHGGFAVGTYSVTAVYSGDASFAASTSAALSQVVNQAATTTTLTSSLNPSRVGQEVTFTANVRSVTGPIPQAQEGTVTFMDGATVLGTAPPNNGVAVLRTSALTVGTHTITATYSGAGSFLASTSDAVQQVVTPALLPTTTIVTSSPNPSIAGQPAIFTAMVSGNGLGTPTGTVTFYAGATALGTVTVASALGTWSLQSSTLPAGTYSITAVYNGDATFASSTSPAINHVVNPAGS